MASESITTAGEGTRKGVSSGGFWVARWAPPLSKEAGSGAAFKRTARGLSVCREGRERPSGWRHPRRRGWAGFCRTGRMDARRWESIPEGKGKMGGGGCVCCDDEECEWGKSLFKQNSKYVASSVSWTRETRKRTASPCVCVSLCVSVCLCWRRQDSGRTVRTREPRPGVPSPRPLCAPHTAAADLGALLGWEATGNVDEPPLLSISLNTFRKNISI